MTERRTAFHDLPEEDFPFVIEFLTQNDVLVHRIEVSGPGVLEVPGMRGIFGPLTVKMIHKNGKVEIYRPD